MYIRATTEASKGMIAAWMRLFTRIDIVMIAIIVFGAASMIPLVMELSAKEAAWLATPMMIIESSRMPTTRQKYPRVSA